METFYSCIVSVSVIVWKMVYAIDFFAFCYAFFFNFAFFYLGHTNIPANVAAVFQLCCRRYFWCPKKKLFFSSCGWVHFVCAKCKNTWNLFQKRQYDSLVGLSRFSPHFRQYIQHSVRCVPVFHTLYFFLLLLMPFCQLCLNSFYSFLRPLFIY